MPATATAIPLPAQPDDKPGAAGRLLGVVRALIAYGRELADALKQHGTAALHVHFARFHTSDLSQILARIARGLQIAAALETKLAGMKQEPKPSALPLPRLTRHAPAASANTRQAADAGNCLPDVATPEQIAALIRRKPIGAVIADICRDLGILPGHKLWRELQLPIIAYGGNLAGLTKDILDRVFPLAAAALRASRPPLPAARGVGPPASGKAKT